MPGRRSPHGWSQEGRRHAREVRSEGHREEGAGQEGGRACQEGTGQEGGRACRRHRPKAGTSKKAAPAKKAAAPAKKAAPKKAFDQKFLEAQKVLLEQERATYERQATNLQAEADELAALREPGDVQFDEESGEGDTLAVERERDLAMSAQARAMIDEIDAALGRMADGTYGICEVSGQPIPKERLKAIPWKRGARRVQGRWLRPPLRGRRGTARARAGGGGDRPRP
ncbi:MAG: TraR/DksA C4-type zinc finger protein [Acidimicrobiales bacterium]